MKTLLLLTLTCFSFCGSAAEKNNVCGQHQHLSLMASSYLLFIENYDVKNGVLRPTYIAINRDRADRGEEDSIKVLTYDTLDEFEKRDVSHSGFDVYISAYSSDYEGEQGFMIELFDSKKKEQASMWVTGFKEGDHPIKLDEIDFVELGC